MGYYSVGLHKFLRESKDFDDELDDNLPHLLVFPKGLSLHDPKAIGKLMPLASSV